MRKILIALIILVAGFLIYNFGITGHIVSEQTTIDFTPKQVKVGEYVYVKLTPSKNGVDILMTVHAKNHMREDTTDAWGHECANYKKTSTGTKCKYPWIISYRVPTNFMPGKYYFRFYDYETDDFMRSDYFEVVE